MRVIAAVVTIGVIALALFGKASGKTLSTLQTHLGSIKTNAVKNEQVR